MESTKEMREELELGSCAIETAPPAGKPDAIPDAEVSKRLRPLQANELVRRGDFVADGHRGFELWEGLTGFRADAFVKPVYRKDESRLSGTSECK